MLLSFIDPNTPEIILQKRKYTQWIVLIDIVRLELVKHNQYNHFHEHLLTEEYIDQPE
jgi:hypothetical protein